MFRGFKKWAVCIGVIAQCGSMVVPMVARAEPYPTRALRLVIPNTPGGPIDIVARIVSPPLTATLGQAVVIDNKSGASQTIGTDAIAKAVPDGYTIGMIGPSHVTNPFLLPKLPYDTARDFEPVSLVARFPLVMIVNPAAGYRTVADVLAQARAHPGQLKYASAGNGGSPHLAAELFKSMTDTDITHIPYRGAPEAEIALMRGEVDFFFDSPAVLGRISDGKLVAIAVTTAERFQFARSLPAVAETVRGYSVETFTGIVAPARTAPDVVAVLNRQVVAAVAQPDVRARLAENMYEPITGTPEQFKAYLDGQTAKWGTLIKARGIHSD